MFNEEESGGGKKLAGWTFQNPANPRCHFGWWGDWTGHKGQGSDWGGQAWSISRRSKLRQTKKAHQNTVEV